MKLRNKLIPIMTLATASTVVAPIASSCGVTYEDPTLKDTMDITSPYTPTIDKAEKKTEKQDSDKAMDIYMDHIIANPEILKQDIWYYESKMLPSRIERIEHTNVDIFGYESYSTAKVSSVTDVVANINVADVVVNRHTAIVRTKQVEFYTISMTLGYEFDFKATSLSTEPRVQLEEKISFQTTYKNVPLCMYHNKPLDGVTESEYPWYVSVDLSSPEIDDYLKELQGGWSFGYNISDEYNYNIVSHGIEQNSGETVTASDLVYRRSQLDTLKQNVQDAVDEYDESGEYSILLYLSSGYMDFASYHMSDVAGYEDNKFQINGNVVEKPFQVKYKKDSETNEWVFTPVKNYFDLFVLADRYSGSWNYIDDVKLSLENDLILKPITTPQYVKSITVPATDSTVSMVKNDLSYPDNTTGLTPSNDTNDAIIFEADESLTEQVASFTLEFEFDPGEVFAYTISWDEVDPITGQTYEDQSDTYYQYVPIHFFVEFTKDE